MFIERIKTPGVAQLSYLVGSEGEAAVIDPRRDVDPYLALAAERGCEIRVIFETHRNEDLVSGACELASRTDAEILHGPQLDFAYGRPAEDGSEHAVGKARLQILHTPGHTDESLSVVLRDDGTGDAAVGVFTGDALFVGDVGRTDFYPERAEEVAAALHASLHEKLLPLGDGVLVYPTLPSRTTSTGSPSAATSFLHTSNSAIR